MSLQAALDAIRSEHAMDMLLAVNEEGLVMACSGETPEEGLPPYAPMAVETATRLGEAGGFGEPVCSALILQDGRMLIFYKTLVAGRVAYLGLLVRKVPRGLRGVLRRIAEELGRSLGETAGEENA